MQISDGTKLVVERKRRAVNVKQKRQGEKGGISLQLTHRCIADAAVKPVSIEMEGNI